MKSNLFSETRRLFPLVFLLFFFACGPKVPPRVALPEADSQRVLEEADSYIRGVQMIHTGRGYAKVGLKVKGHRRSFDEAVVVGWPDSFRFETLDDLGNTQFLIVSDGETLAWQDFIKKESSEHQITEERLRRFLPVVESVRDTLGLLIGRLPLQDLSGAAVSREANSGLNRIVTLKGEMVWDPEGRYIVSLALKGEDGKFRYQYEGWDFVDRPIRGSKGTQVRAPSRIHLKDLKTGNEIDLFYRDLSVDTISSGISPSLFRLNAESGMKRLDDRE